MEVIQRVAARGAVGLESTLLVHGVPRGEAMALHAELCRRVREAGATPALVGVYRGRAIVGLTDAELSDLLTAESVAKLNASNLGVALHRGMHGATTVSATMELCAAAGVRVFATGGLGGLHQGLEQRVDISADLGAFTRFPVAVVTSGVKGLLDVEGTRELLESMGVPVIGFRTDAFPAFYRRESRAGVDARFDDAAELGAFVRAELARTGRGVVVCNPIPAAHEIDDSEWREWLDEARAAERSADGRDVTPRLLARLHRVSGGRTLTANVELVKHNASVAGELARNLTP